jgi:hypothetical protein
MQPITSLASSGRRRRPELPEPSQGPPIALLVLSRGLRSCLELPSPPNGPATTYNNQMAITATHQQQRTAKTVPGDASTTPGAATTAANAARHGVLSRPDSSTIGTPCVLAPLGSGLAVSAPGVSESPPVTSTARGKGKAERLRGNGFAAPALGWSESSPTVSKVEVEGKTASLKADAAVAPESPPTTSTAKSSTGAAPGPALATPGPAPSFTNFNHRQRSSQLAA